MRNLCKKVSDLAPEQREELAKKFPISTCEGRTLSVFNQCFLQMQSESTLTLVGGFKQWKKVGRVVRKGEHSAGSIFVPLGKKKEEEVDPEDDSVKFILVSMFDITQTEEISSEEKQES
jgi:hypothetical protein